MGSSGCLGPLVAKLVAQVRGFATDIRDTETPQNQGDAAESRNSQLLRQPALGHATAASRVQMATGIKTVGSGPATWRNETPRMPVSGSRGGYRKSRWFGGPESLRPRHVSASA